MTQIVGFPSVEDYNRVIEAARIILRSGIEHPFYRRQPLTDIPELIIAKADGDVTKGSSGTFSIWEGPIGGESDTGTDITAYVRFGDIAEDSWVAIFPRNDGWEAIAAECL